MESNFKELELKDLNILINKYIIYYNAEGGKWTYDLAKKMFEQTFLTPCFYGIGLYGKSIFWMEIYTISETIYFDFIWNVFNFNSNNNRFWI